MHWNRLENARGSFIIDISYWSTKINYEKKAAQEFYVL